MADARRLAEVGFPVPLAKELADQINAGVGNRRRLIELSMVPALAALVASFIGGTPVASKLAELGMATQQALEFARQAGGAPSNAVRSSLSTGYVRNASGGYVLRSFT